MKKFLLLSISILFAYHHSFSQCAAGEVEVEIVVNTDNYGYEGYWQLLPSGNDCNEDPIFIGGNASVGCSGAGDQNQAPGGYGNNVSITEGPWCLNEGEQYDIFFADDWGDGGFTFDVIVNGFLTETLMGMGLGGTYTFTASEPADYDLSVFGSNLYSYVEIGSFTIDADIFNYGTEDITSYTFNYSVDGGPAVTMAVTDTEIPNYESVSIEHETEWTISDFGTYELAIWVSDLNGNEDEVPENDTLFVTVEAGDGIPNIIDDYVNSLTEITEIAGSGEQINNPTDLDFHPVLSKNELWVINKDTEATGGSTVTIYNAGESDQTELWKRDGNAWHFMSLPTGIAFSENTNFANSPGVYDANHNGGDAFTGPALWSSDMDIYAEPSGGNGSHLDMTHASPYCQGIAYETGNAFWVFDGYSNDIVRNDFVDDHGPGNDFHADARILRYADDEVLKDSDDLIVSHLVLDDEKQWLYVVDHGNNRVIRIDINTGDIGGTPDYPDYEGYMQYEMVTNYVQETVVSDLIEPAGIDVIEDRMIVSEHSSGDIIIYDISVMPALELDRIETGFSSLQGIKIGPDGKIWGVDYNTENVFRVDPAALSADNEEREEPRVFPNPTKDLLYFRTHEKNSTIHVIDMGGNLVDSYQVNNTSGEIDLSGLSNGVYTLRIQGENSTYTKKVVKL
ncbi:MAG TPA: T9SS type A sorting domain-containing protein [Cryomorphaceae bacterium]|nr:T9SS type A sorting domain-containing protein [Cryomorphaceae bacterium]